tara:strand:+ start:490 stop:810 length:321 start_codon:yes stop_codon:yes gene_type:complete
MERSGTKTIKQTIHALRNKKKVLSKDLQFAYLNMDNIDRKLLKSLVKNRRRELLLQFSETGINSLWNQITTYDKFMYLFTKNEAYNMNKYFDIQGEYVLGNAHQSY